MIANEYHFITHWRLKASRTEIVDIIGNADDLPRWWPSVYLEVRTLEQGDASGVGKRVALYTKGWLPYTLRWQFVVTEAAPPDGFTLVAEGDFVGQGVWAFRQDGEFVDIQYDWRISAQKPILKYLSFIMKPLFSMNHLWAMARGEESLRLELLRRHAATDAERLNIPAPPASTPGAPLKWLLHVLGWGSISSPRSVAAAPGR
jgi:hypothetical protein